MVSENGKKVERPVQLTCTDDYSTLQVQLLDTIERYTVTKVTKHYGSLILKIKSGDCSGYVTITKQTTHRGEITGTVWFYQYCNRKKIERHYVINSNRCFNLVKKYRKESQSKD